MQRLLSPISMDGLGYGQVCFQYIDSVASTGPGDCTNNRMMNAQKEH